MALKKSDLYSSLWRSCDELRGGMDASQYKDYILTLLFVKYVSDKAKTDTSSLIDVPTGGSFDDMLVAKGDKEIGDRFNKIIGKLAEANGLRNVIDQADFNDEEKLGKGKEMQDRLSKLVTIFHDLDFRGSRAEGDDLLGDAYEYLMRHFATESGKSKGQFYTPAEVSRILAKVVGINGHTRQDQTVYDPACGSGSLLLKAADQAPRGMTIYGQEKDNATWALSRMNMILHGNEIAEIAKGDTITSPQFVSGHQLKTFDYIVMNPPFSVKSWSNGLENDYGRFEYGRPPEKNGDYAFLLHALKSLKSNGKAAVILPHGVLFRGNAEGTIRTRLLKQGFIKGVIGLPPNLFYGTSIPACIVILDKEDAVARTGVFMMDASKGFIKDGNKNRLRSQDIHKVVDTFNKQIEIPRYSRMVPMSEIADAKNDYNLNLPRYIDSSAPEDLQDLHAHLHGGIPDRDLDALSRYWDAFPQLRSQLFKPNRPGYSDLTLDVGEVQQAILDSTEFQRFADEARGLTADWFTAQRATLAAIDENTRPNDLITDIGEDLHSRFKPMAFLDEYDVYEQLMAYWHDTMHDDVFLVMNDGWVDAAKPRKTIEDKERKLSETPDLVIGTGRKAQKYKMDLVPPALLVARYFADEQSKVDELAAAAEEATRGVEEFVEEHAVEEGLLAEAMDDDKISKVLVTARLRVAKKEASDPDEVKALQVAIHLYDAESAAKKAVKDEKAALDLATLKKYGELRAADIVTLVLEDKWHATLNSLVDNEVNSLTHTLVMRLEELGDRYSQTVSSLDAEIVRFADEVTLNLQDIGVGSGLATQLIRGHVRLPGFSGPWAEMRLGDLATLGSGGTPPSGSPHYYGGGIPWVSISDMTSSGKYVERTDKTLSSAGLANSAAKVYDDGVVLYAMYASLGECAIAVGRVSSSQAILGISVGPRLDRDYLYYYLSSIKSTVREMGQQGTQSNLNAGMVRGFVLNLPPIDEQRAIAKVLASIDGQVNALERRLLKAGYVKSGLAQQLLAPRAASQSIGASS